MKQSNVVKSNMMVGVKLSCFLALYLWGISVHAEDTPRNHENEEASTHQAGAFAQSRKQVALGGGGAQIGGSSYLALQGRVNYFLLDGFSADLGLGVWIPFGDGAPLFQVAPGMSYFFYQLRPIVPYLGGFYEHTLTTLSLRSPSALGARAGLIFASNASLIGLGARVTRQLSCIQDCDQVVPELILQLSF